MLYKQFYGSGHIQVFRFRTLIFFLKIFVLQMWNPQMWRRAHYILSCAYLASVSFLIYYLFKPFNIFKNWVVCFPFSVGRVLYIFSTKKFLIREKFCKYFFPTSVASFFISLQCLTEHRFFFFFSIFKFFHLSINLSCGLCFLCPKNSLPNQN